MSKEQSGGGVGVGGLLLVAFIVLKLCDVIDWNWFWVLSPLWIPFAILGLFGAIAFLVAFIALFFKR